MLFTNKQFVHYICKCYQKRSLLVTEFIEECHWMFPRTFDNNSVQVEVCN